MWLYVPFITAIDGARRAPFVTANRGHNWKEAKAAGAVWRIAQRSSGEFCPIYNQKQYLESVDCGAENHSREENRTFRLFAENILISTLSSEQQ